MVYSAGRILYIAVRHSWHPPIIIYSRDHLMDATAIGAVLSVIGSIIVFVVLGVRITRLMKSCNSQD